ncbi:MAG TPA: DUF4105 domain-containing protein [Chthoniobacterales bacterium]
MKIAESHSGNAASSRLAHRVGRWFLAAIGVLILIVLVAWATLAIYYSSLPWPWLRVVLAATFLAFSVWALWLTKRPHMSWAFAGLFVVVAVAWLFIQPSHDRPWRSEVAVMPRAIIDGDRVRFTGFRNFDYRSRDDFTARYEEREVQISHLTGVDFFVSYWKIGPVSHTFVSFIFDNAPPVSISIETRPEVGEGFDPLASLFKQFELIYVVGDERDIVRVRTNYRDEDVFLYRINTSPADARRLFLVYLQRINQLADRPEFYHLLSNSCTINIVRYANAAGRVGGFDFRHLLNGFIDGYLYASGRMNSTLPFDELRRRSWINDAAQVAGNAEDFSQRIRASLPTVRP